MASIEKRRRTLADGTFGPVHYRVRYRIADGTERSATKKTLAEARAFLATTSAAVVNSQWVDPTRGRTTFAEYFGLPAERRGEPSGWLATRTIRRSTLDLYDGLGRNHLLPWFGTLELAKITSESIEQWRAAMLRKGRWRGQVDRDGVVRVRMFGDKPTAEAWLASEEATAPPTFHPISPNTVAKAYRLLAEVMKSAAAHKVIVVSPCVIERAGIEDVAERRTASVEQLWDLVDTMPEHHRALVLVAAFVGLRWGELAGLRRRHVDVMHKTIKVVEQLTEVNGVLEFAPPKTAASRRTVTAPDFVVAELAQHLARWSEAGPDGLVFPAPEGGPMRRSNFRRRVWAPATRRVGLDWLRFHDLRHSAGTLAAVAGGTTREVMARMGHATQRAALIYQHACEERDAAIASALDALAAQTRPTEQTRPALATVHSL